MDCETLDFDEVTVVLGEATDNGGFLAAGEGVPISKGRELRVLVPNSDECVDGRLELTSHGQKLFVNAEALETLKTAGVAIG